MSIGRIRCLMIGGALALAAGASPAAARPGVRCGVGLVAGLAGCIDWKMKVSEYRNLVARALKGDREAAVALANFENFRDDKPADAGRKWWILAAERGDCEALARMRSEAVERGQRAALAKWQTRISWNRCPAS